MLLEKMRSSENPTRWSTMWWSPLHEFSMLRDTMNELFSHFLSDNMPATYTTNQTVDTNNYKDYTFMPTMNMWQKDNMLYMEFSLPGVNKENINIHTTSEELTIEGMIEMPEEMKDCSFYTYEVPFGKFHRTITYPMEVKHEEMKAKFENGMLKICVPLMHATENKHVKINIE